MKTKEKVLKILSELSASEDIDTDDSFEEDLGLDSLSMVSMLLEFEDAFKIEFNECDMNPYDLLTVGDAVSLVKRYVDG